MRDLNYLNDHRVKLELFKNLGYNEDCEGVFDLLINGKNYFVIATSGLGWQHVSVSGHNGILPTWDIMETVKNRFFNDNEFVVEYHPKKAEYVNNVENCLHLWSPQGRELPYPNLEEIRKSKPKLLSKQAIRVNGKGYLCEHYESADFEFVNIQGFGQRPEWSAICEIKQQIFGDVVAVSYHAKKGDLLYKQNKNKTDRITIWKSTQDKIFTPNPILVGIKGLSQNDLSKMSDEDLFGMF